MRFAALILFVTIGISSPAFAILRPRFPVKPSPPYQGESVITGDDSLRNPKKC
jgi:hypothetical protein